MSMTCNNCGRKQPPVLVHVNRYRLEDGGLHPENWCLDCIQGKNPVREQFDIPDEWR